MVMNHAARFAGATAIEAAVTWIFSELGSDVRIATPLGLGKPNPLLNALYRRVRAEPARNLILFTALSLAPPSPKEDLARRFFSEFRDRHWGKDYPELEYARDAARGKLPPNVRVHEFYFQAGSALASDSLQRHHVSVNYTHVAVTVAQMGVELIVQAVARRRDPDGRERFSLSSNPDLTLDVDELYRKRGRSLRVVGVIHPDLPFMGGDAEVDPGFFAAIVESPAMSHALFALPRVPIDEVDHRIGFIASGLIPDGGTLQIGIGSLSDAVVAAMIFRHRENPRYRALLADVLPAAIRSAGEVGPFTEGLYGLSELVTDGFMHLRRAGILRREVVDESTGTKTYLHGAFFLGSRDFYEWLRDLPAAEADGVRMTRVSKVNDLYDPNELLLRRQRKSPRFLNTCMQATLLGGAASDTLENGRVVSGVGGQYNFVAMSHELPDSRSILMLRSSRRHAGKRVSNIVWGHGMLTIPRHLRDIVITEYGVADLRGQDDETCVRRMIEIADAEFQPALAEIARRHGKLSDEYRIPSRARENTPARVREFIERERAGGLFAEFPFGTEFTPVEARLAQALGVLRQALDGSALRDRIRFVAQAMGKAGGTAGEAFYPELARMGLAHPSGVGERIKARLLRAALRGGKG